MLPTKIIIADDEPGVLIFLHTILNSLNGALVEGSFGNATDAIKLTEEKNPDLAFLDIELPDMSGIALAERLRQIHPDLAIVFITAHEEFSLDAFKLYASDYILKPISPERVKKTFYRVQQMLETSEKRSSASHLQHSRISVTLGNERVFVRLCEIFYIEKAGHHTLIHSDRGEFKVRDTLQDLEQYLFTGFFRSHKSFIINVDRVDRIVNLPNSSYYEIKFKNYEGKALLSRDRVHALMAYSHFNA